MVSVRHCVVEYATCFFIKMAHLPKPSTPPAKVVPCLGRLRDDLRRQIWAACTLESVSTTGIHDMLFSKGKNSLQPEYIP